jgi:peptide/nickel transport system substrate-binding protein
VFEKAQIKSPPNGIWEPEGNGEAEMNYARMRRVCALAFGLTLTASIVHAQTLTLGVRGGPESMDPHYSALGTHAEAMKHVFDTLVWSDENLQLQPGLAESWRPIDDLKWEFKLRQGVTFHDGSPFTARDVKFSIERIPVVTGPTTMEIYVRRVANIEIVDDYTMMITTNAPAATLPNDFVRLFIVSADAAADYSTPETAAAGFNTGAATIGTGPFKYVSWEPNGELVLERYDGYWRGPAAWEQVVRREIPNDSSRLAALQAGQVDLINYVSSSDYQTLQRDGRVDVFIADSAYVMNLQLDQRDTSPKVYDNAGNVLAENPLRDARVREAIDLAIDRETMVEIVLEGLGKPANQIMPQGFFGSSDAIPDRGYDPDRARTLLADAGFPDGFTIDLFCTNDRLPGDGAICQGLGQMFTQVGIKTNVNAISRTVYFPTQARKEYSVFMNGWGTLTGEGSYTLGSLVHSPNEELKLGAFNRIEYSNPDVDTALQEAIGTLDDTKRRALFEKAMELSMADRAYIPVVVLQTVWAGAKGKVSYTPRADEDTLAYYVEKLD